MSKNPHVDKANKYARDIVGGKIPANRWVKLACKRHLDDLAASKQPNAKHIFDNRAAEKACKFIEMLPHTKGKWAQHRELIVLEPWQCFFVCSIFGWLWAHSRLRRFRIVLLLVPRKNGKSILAAAIGLYMLTLDGEHGAEVYCGATTEKQALEVFRPAKQMAERTPDLREAVGLEVNAQSLVVPEVGSRFEPIIGNPGDGSSPHLAIADEYHEHKDDRLVDTMVTGMGSREQPMLLAITTAGDNLAGPCYALELDLQKVLEGVVPNDEFFGLIYGIDPGDDWGDEATLRKANPNFGVSISADFLRARLQDAKNSARKLAIYLTKHLNVWVGSREAFFNMDKWRQCEEPELRIEDFYGQPAYFALDLASRVDIAALEVLIPRGDGQFVKFGRYYLPEDALQIEHYRGWAEEGRLQITDGEIIDFNEIKADILELVSKFELRELAYDPFQATMLITELMDEGVPVVEMRPTVLNFSEPMKELDALIRAGQIKHDGCPVFSWMLSNVTAKLDKKDNVYPNKERPENKIDGPVALIMALGRALQRDENGLLSAIENPLSVKL